MATRTLEDALKEMLKDDNRVSKYEARVLREMIMADGTVTAEEREFLDKALRNNHFDDEAFDLLSGVLLRSHLKE